MNEETITQNQRVIELTQKQFAELQRAMQWPEDLPQWDKDNTPTNFGAILGKLTTL